MSFGEDSDDDSLFKSVDGRVDDRADSLFSPTNTHAGEEEDDDARWDHALDDGGSQLASSGERVYYEGYDPDVLGKAHVGYDGARSYAPNVSAGDPAPIQWPWFPVTRSQLEDKPVRHARALVFNIPGSFFRDDAATFKDMLVCQQNPTSSAATTALLGMLFQGVNNGTPSGQNHEEIYRARAAAA